jgi:hypothetical protein
MARKKSRREALRTFSAAQQAAHKDAEYGSVENVPLCADRVALERHVDAAWKKYQRCKAVEELEALRANGGRVH